MNKHGTDFSAAFPPAVVVLAVLSTYQAELIPTPCRSTVMGLLRQVSQLGSISAPFIVMGADLPIAGLPPNSLPFIVST